MATMKNEQMEQLQQPLDENELDQVTGGVLPPTAGTDNQWNSRQNPGDNNNGEPIDIPNPDLIPPTP